MPSFTRDPERVSDLALAGGGAIRRRMNRDRVEEVLALAGSLPRDERAVVYAVLRDALPVREVAEVRGESPRVVRRRLRNAVDRVLTPLFGFALSRVEAKPCPWSAARRRVAVHTVLHGRSLQKTAQALGVSVWSVRREKEKILAEFEAFSARARHGADAA